MALNKRNMSHLGRLALFAAALSWGTSFVILKNTLDSISTLYVLAFRFTGAAILMLPVAAKEFKKLDLRYLAGGIAMGVMLFFAYVFQTYGLYYTTPGKNAFLTATYCVLVPFLFWIFFRRRPDRYNVLAALLCLLGIGLISLDGLSIGIGDLLTLISGIFFAVHIVVIDRSTPGRSPVMLTMLQFVTAAVLSWISALLFEPFPTAVEPSAIMSIIYLCVVCTAISFFLQTFGQKYTPPAQAAVLITLEAVFGAAISILFFDEEPELRVLIGFVVVFAAVLVSETKLQFLPKRSGKKE